MNIIVFNGSPRGERGNTHAMVKEFLSGAEEAGAKTENIFLVDKKIGYCRGCFTCWSKTPGRCCLNDDVAELLEKLKAADVVVFATPLYVDNVTGIMKNFMDRLIPLVDGHFAKDASGECKHPPRSGDTALKKMVVVSNCGFPEQSQFQVLRLLFRRIARNTGAELAGEIYRGGGELFSTRSIVVAALLLSYRRLLRKAGRELVADGRISDATTASLERRIVTDAQYIRGANRHWDELTQ